MQVPNTSQEVLYVAARAANTIQLFFELKFSKGAAGVDVVFKSIRADLATMAFESLAAVL